jgi:hypothetical protein
VTFLKSVFFCFTVPLVISHYLPHCLSLSPFPLPAFLPQHKSKNNKVHTQWPQMKPEK